MKTILVLNGPNLNMLGSREPSVYGSATLADLDALCAESAEILGYAAQCFQSNHEGELVEAIQAASTRTDLAGIVINAGAYTHTSVAIHDALRLVKPPIVEVHISNPMARESFRHTSYIAPLARASIAGLGAEGYRVAVAAIARFDAAV